MTTRAIWSGSLTFGLINIPVRLHKSSRDATVHFRNLHAACNTPINMKKWCAACEKEVSADELNKGYKVEKDKFVVLTEREIEAAAIEESKAIKVEKVIEFSEVPITALDNSFYLAPADKSPPHAYALLAKALEGRRQALIGRFAMRTKEHLCIIQAWNHGLLLSVLKWQDELHEIEPLLTDVAKETIPDEEIALANMLLDRMKGAFKHEEYRDTYREKIQAIIDMKMKGEALPTVTEAKPTVATPRNIMDELRKSIEVLA